MIKELELLELDEIESIEFLGEEETIDICVEDTHMFFANDIYTHNSGFNTEYADEQSIGKAIEVYQVCDLMIFFTQSIGMQDQEECYGQLMKNRLGKKGIALKIGYNPNHATFEELEVVSRLSLMDKGEKGSVLRGIDKIRKQNLERANK